MPHQINLYLKHPRWLLPIMLTADDKVIISIHENPLVASSNLQAHLNLISSCPTPNGESN